MTIHRIERIAMPSREAFFRGYVIPRRPVIITNVFEGEPIRQIDSIDRAREAFGDVALEVKLEYSLALSSLAAQRRSGNGSQASSIDARMAATWGVDGIGTMKLGEYLDFAEVNPATRLLCTEYAVPSRVAAQYTLPPLCVNDARSLAETEILKLPRKWGDHDLFSNMFIANRGNYAHIHHDGDHRQVLLYQVFGRKRVILFQPSCGAKLDHLESFSQAFCNTYLQDMTEEQKLALIDGADGYEATLEPGEAVYMPMLIWHYLEYLDTGMSVGFRFGRNKYGRFLCVDNLHRDYYVQNVAAKMVEGDRYAHAIDEIIATFVRPCVSRTAKIREMRGLFKRLCAEIAPEAQPDEYCPPEREEHQIAQIEADLEGGVRYLGDVVTMAAGAAAVGGISASQNRVIESRIRQLAYPRGAFGKVLYNQFAKSAIDSLTKTEAALLIRALSSPGAVW